MSKVATRRIGDIHDVRRAIPIAAAVIVTAAARGAAMWLARPAAPARVVSRFVIPFGEGQERTITDSQGLAISPDGTTIARPELRVVLNWFDELERARR